MDTEKYGTSVYMSEAKTKAQAEEKAKALVNADPKRRAIGAKAERFAGGEDYHVNWRVEVSWELI